MKAVRKKIMPHVELTCICTDKFKTNCLSVNLLTQLNRATASQNALIPRVLRRGSARYPDMESISAALDELYGARLEPIARKKGEIQAVGFYADFSDDAFLPGNERLLEKVAALLGELLLSPNTRGGLLLPQYVDSEREKLLEQIRARINEKRGYALHRLFELMCFSEDYAVDRLGTEEEAAAINYTKLTKRYKELLMTSPIEIFYCGGADPIRVERAVLSALETLPRGEIDRDCGTDIRLNAIDDSPRYFTEEMDVSQGKLAVGFRLGDCMVNPEPAAIRVANAVYGGSVTSKLFMNVREKLSLAYYASSVADWHKGIMAVSSGIEVSNYDAALGEIFAQLDAMRNGDISDDELTAAKRYVVSSLRAIPDMPGSLEDFYLGQNIEGLDDGPEDMAEAAEAVTAGDVVKIAAGIECDAVYFLKGEESEDEAEADTL